MLNETRKKGELLRSAILIAVEAHADQFDKGGQPYILHPLAVMYLLSTDDEELKCIAILHDVIEDNKNFTYQGLREKGMTERIIEGVRCLTKVPGETYAEYKAKVKSNIDAIRVKRKDLKHNTKIERLKGVTRKDMDRMEKYFNFYIELDGLEKE